MILSPLLRSVRIICPSRWRSRERERSAAGSFFFSHRYISSMICGLDRECEISIVDRRVPPTPPAMYLYRCPELARRRCVIDSRQTEHLIKYKAGSGDRARPIFFVLNPLIHGGQCKLIIDSLLTFFTQKRKRHSTHGRAVGRVEMDVFNHGLIDVTQPPPRESPYSRKKSVSTCAIRA